MRFYIRLLILTIFCLYNYAANGQLYTTINRDFASIALTDVYTKRISEIKRLNVQDSNENKEVKPQINELESSDNQDKEQVLEQLKSEEDNEKLKAAITKAKIDSLRETATGFPIIGIMQDTLIMIYSKFGAFTAKERAERVTRKIKLLYEDDYLNIDSLSVADSENTLDIVYGETIIMSVSETDAKWHDKSRQELAYEFKDIIKASLIKANKEYSSEKILTRLGLALFVVILAWLIIWLIGKGYNRSIKYITSKKEKWFKNLIYKDYTFLSIEQELRATLILFRIIRWFIYVVLFYISLPIIFSIFPFSRNWADKLFQLVWSPLKNIFIAIYEYLPNLFTILVIFLVMKYFVRLIKYFFTEIYAEKLKISGFYPEWAMPTFNIIRFLLYTFMFILIFPYLPGSESNIFKGVSIFIGVLFSLGSSTAIANMVAGLVITYMSPFKMGDRIKIGEISGDVIEKTLLITRIRTIKNEVITIPNSSVLSGNTTNYSTEARNHGLIINTSVTIGYDVPWKDMHQALLEAARRTDLLLKEPAPFVLQTSLEDFYVSYQINAYTQNAGNQAVIYSNLHQNIQDVCNEKGIEILSPHYRANRDGNAIAIPAAYLSKNKKD